MNRLQIVCYSYAGEIVEIIRDLPVPITASVASVMIMTGEFHGPRDVPCGHDECRASLEVRTACARAEELAADSWERAEHEDWSDYCENDEVGSG